MWLLKGRLHEARCEERTQLSKIAILRTEGREIRATILDISPSGVRLLAHCEPSPGNKYTLTFSAGQMEFTSQLDVVRWTASKGGIVWGCRRTDVSQSAIGVPISYRG